MEEGEIVEPPPAPPLASDVTEEVVPACEPEQPAAALAEVDEVAKETIQHVEEAVMEEEEEVKEEAAEEVEAHMDAAMALAAARPCSNR